MSGYLFGTVVVLAGLIALGAATLSFSWRILRGIRTIVGRGFAMDEDEAPRQAVRRRPGAGLLLALLLSPLCGLLVIVPRTRRMFARVLVDEAIRNNALTSEQHTELLRLADEA